MTCDSTWFQMQLQLHVTPPPPDTVPPPPPPEMPAQPGDFPVEVPQPEPAPPAGLHRQGERPPHELVQC